MLSQEEFVRRIPKAELHVHIEGTLEPKMLLDLAKRNDISLPWSSAEAVEAAYDFDSLPHFLDLYFAACKVMVKERDFYDVTRAYLVKASEDGVLRAEMFLGPQTFTSVGLDLNIVMNGVFRAIDDVKNSHGIDGALIVSAQRHRTEEESFKLLDDVKPWYDRIVGFGLGGAEIGNPPSKFANYFKECRARGFKTTIHAGEEGPPAYVGEAIGVLAVDRIDHGVAAISDDQVLEELVRRQTPLTVCPLSNYRLKVFKTMAEHPLKKMLEMGLLVTINSDDPPYFGGYINENIIETQKHTGLSQQQVIELAKNGFKGSFMSAEEKRRCVALVEKFAEDNT